MQLTFNSSQTLSETATQFSGYFSLLKIEFFNTNHSAHEGTLPSEILDKNLTWESLGVKKELVIEFDAAFSVVKMESLIKEITGVGAQIYRNSHGTWLQTTATDSLTLAEQQEKAEEYAHSVDDSEEVGDYHEQE